MPIIIHYSPERTIYKKTYYRCFILIKIQLSIDKLIILWHCY